MADLIDRFNRLDTTGKIAVFGVVLVILTFGLALWKQGVFILGRTGSSGALMPFLHHSRWGAIMAVIGSYLILKPKSIAQRTIGLWLVVVGLFLVIQHLATEQCFALITASGTPSGGIC